MNGFEFAKNTHFDWNNSRFRVEAVNPDSTIVIYCLGDGKISVQEQHSLLKEYSAGTLRFSAHSQNSEQMRLITRPISEFKKEIQDEYCRRLKYIQAIYRCCSDRPNVSEVDRVRLEVARTLNEQSPPSRATIYRWLARTNIAHGDSRSLIPRFDRRGPRGAYVDQEIIRLFEDAVNEAFNKTPAADLPQITAILRDKINAENELRNEKLKLWMPSKTTCHRLLQRMDQYQLACYKDGKRKSSRVYRLVGKGVETTRVLERYEIDHTPMDVFVVDESTKLPLGRPWLTMIIDHYSRMPVGYYIGFTPPSTASIFSAMRHAILPKKLIKVDGLTTHNAWPCYGIPQIVVSDNGLEFHGMAFETLLFNTGIQLLLCPKHEPQFKGVIERFLKTINYQFSHMLPGTSLAKYYLRGEYEPEKHAVLTLTELKAVIEKWMIDIYAQRVHRTLGVTPYSRWVEGTKKVTPKLPADIGILEQSFGIPSKRSLRKDGILIHGLRYSDPNLQNVLNRYGPGIRVSVVYDPDDLGQIKVFEPDVHDKFVRAHAVFFEYADGLTQYQNKVIQAQVREKGEDSSNENSLMEAKLEVAAWADALVHHRKTSDRRKGKRLQPKEKVEANESDRKGRAVDETEVKTVNDWLEDAFLPRVSSEAIMRFKHNRYRQL